ncbi:RNA methyltransferase [Candidatus Finniella inopinata]|uniref:RNA methyltransferase n=1 Tax=Candidatus Finniella inopinata TaxID=1696036 RepID=UPI0013EE5A02|nr:RNA methyltransferase [Candidatus Finniella inopinata]
MKPIIILVETQLPENLGSVARVMANFGLSKLRLVKPQAQPLDPKAIALSVGAFDILDDVIITENFEEAVADLNYVFATTAYQRDMIKAYETPKTFVDLIKKPEFQEERFGIVFGPERTGLTNDYMARCHKAITIPVNPDFSSLNLAQAVSVIAYEWFQSQSSQALKACIQLGKTTLATQGQMNGFLNLLEKNLDQTNFWRVSTKKPIMWRNLQNLFTRLDLTQQDLKTLCGVVDALSKSLDKKPD